MSNALQCVQLTKSYLQGKIKTSVLKGLDLTVAKGELLAIVGSSAFCGKLCLIYLDPACRASTSQAEKRRGFTK